jgi:hypothetical protein
LVTEWTQTPRLAESVNIRYSISVELAKEDFRLRVALELDGVPTEPHFSQGDVIKPCLSFLPTNGEACPYYQNQLCPCPVSQMHLVVLPGQCRGLLQNDSVYGSNEREQGLFRIHAQDDPGIG